MVYFRIEDVLNSMGIARNYQIEYENLPVIDKKYVEYYIAEEIRKQVNGSSDRNLLSYSKSLGVCLLKYNEYCDNELHICYDNYTMYDYVAYYNISKNSTKYKYYSLESSLRNNKLFNKDGKIKLYNFRLDVSDNSVLNEYLLKFTNKGLKKYASPEKDSEVIMMQACNDIVIKEYLDSIYTLYALQLRYKFMNDYNIVESIIYEILQLEDLRFEYCKQEREAIIFLVIYLYYNTEREEAINKKIFEYADKKDRFPLCYDSISEFHGIKENDFEDSYHLSDYNDNVVSNIFWKYCMRYLEGIN